MGRGRGEQTRIRIRRGGGILGKKYFCRRKSNPLLLSVAENDAGASGILQIHLLLDWLNYFVVSAADTDKINGKLFNENDHAHVPGNAIRHQKNRRCELGVP
jgi:hypothetical protein